MEKNNNNRPYRFGWLPDYPDIRDYTEKHDKLQPILKMTSVRSPEKAAKMKLKETEDLRFWFSNIEDQKTIGSCTANAGVGIIEYFQRRAFGKHIDASRLFLYKTTRNLMHITGDTGAFLRTTMGAIRLFGVPPEEYWPYTDVVPTEPNIPDYHFDLEPPAFCYAFASNYKSIKYVRLDPPEIAMNTILDRIKLYLASGLPSMFGFSVYRSYEQSNNNGGKIPIPCSNEECIGGHAIVAVGYDDNMEIANELCDQEKTKGALLIRNSWGTGWGDKGYGWLPYEYVLQGAADDFWVLLSQEWVNTNQFKI